MLERYELYVACRRRVAIAAVADGILCEELQPREWGRLPQFLPFPETPVQVLQLRRDRGDELALFTLAQACADAGDGVVLAVAPVRSPAHYELAHDGRGRPPADWPGVLTRARAYRTAAEQAEAAERARHAEAVAAWNRSHAADERSDLGRGAGAPRKK